MRNEDWKRARLEELWQSHVDDGIVAADQDRLVAAVEAIRLLREVASRALAEDDEASASVAQTKGRALWALITAELAGWMLDLPGLPAANDSEAWDGRERVAVLGQIALSAIGTSPLHREAVDPASLILPRWLLKRLQHALEALEDGEVQPMVLPIISGRHGPSWSWDKMRLRAAQHVAFLNGQGIPVTLARQRVGSLTAVPPETLRKWEVEFSAHPETSAARGAGELKVIFEDTPRYAEGDGNSIDAHAMHCLETLRQEPLAAFGDDYRERFGRRHNPSSTDTGGKRS